MLYYTFSPDFQNIIDAGLLWYIAYYITPCHTHSQCVYCYQSWQQTRSFVGGLLGDQQVSICSHIILNYNWHILLAQNKFCKLSRTIIVRLHAIDHVLPQWGSQSAPEWTKKYASSAPPVPGARTAILHDSSSYPRACSLASWAGSCPGDCLQVLEVSVRVSAVPANRMTVSKIVLIYAYEFLLFLPVVFY